MDITSASNFYVTLPSNSSGSDNKTGEYTVQLPSTLFLDGTFEVALAEFTYPHTFKNVSANFEEKSKQMVTSVYAHHERGMVHFEIPESHYESALDLCKALNKSMRYSFIEMTDKLNNFMGTTEWIDIHNYLKFRYDPVFKKVKISVSNDYGKKLTLLILSDHLAYMLGFKERFIQLGGPNSTAAMKDIWGEYMVDMTGGLNVMYIYSNIVQPQLVGNSLAPLLRAVPISGTSGSLVRETFQSRQYVNVVVNQISHITITIKSDHGQQIPFDYGKSLAVLHFRRKKQHIF